MCHGGSIKYSSGARWSVAKSSIQVRVRGCHCQVQSVYIVIVIVRGAIDVLKNVRTFESVERRDETRRDIVSSPPESPESRVLGYRL